MHVSFVPIKVAWGCSPCSRNCASETVVPADTARADGGGVCPLE